MAAGLPGTGIGGLFFILSAFFMLVVEIVRTVRGRSSLARWRLVGRQVAIATAMVAAVTASVWAVHGLLFDDSDRARGSRGAHGASSLLTFSPVLITLSVLATVLAAAFCARFVFARRKG
jgi:hypothetical protein